MTPVMLEFNGHYIAWQMISKLNDTSAAVYYVFAAICRSHVHCSVTP